MKEKITALYERLSRDDEQQLMVRSLYELRNSQLEKDGPVEPVEDLLLRVIDAPTKKEKRRKDREAR